MDGRSYGDNNGVFRFERSEKVIRSNVMVVSFLLFVVKVDQKEPFSATNNSNN